MCGGTGGREIALGDTDGLSPRVRGNLEDISFVLAEIGSIPACAGEPSPRRGRWRTWWVYPRVCGGTAVGTHTTSPHRGLSPRVRGNLQFAARMENVPGSIPACAGEPDGRGSIRQGPGVYPRVCGGTGETITLPTTAPGLSPRVRGNRDPRPRRHVGARSIPACAGEPVLSDGVSVCSWVYPRVCGGTIMEIHDLLLAAGLSPRVRGNPARRHPPRAR